MVKKTHLEPFMVYLADRQYSQLAITNYEVTARKFLEMIGKEPKDITIEDVELYVRAMNTNINNGKPYSNNAKISKFSGLKAYIEYLNLKVLKGRKIEYDKQLLHPPSATIPDKEVLTKEEIRRLFDSAKSNKRDLAIITTLYYSTQRKKSIQSLNISDINWNTGEIWIRHGTKPKKGVYEYQVSIKEAIPILRDYIDNQREEPKPGNEDALFLNGTGQRICKETINIILKRHVVNSGITKRVYPHLLRATGVTIMDSLGMTRDQIVKRTGHKDIDSLKTYIRPNPVECNKKADECLSLDTPLPELEKLTDIKPESKKHTPTDVYISKPLLDDKDIELLRLKIQLLEMERNKQHQQLSETSIYS